MREPERPARRREKAAGTAARSAGPAAPPRRPGGSTRAPRAPPCALGLARRRRRLRATGLPEGEGGRPGSRWAGCGPAAAGGGRQAALGPARRSEVRHGLQHEEAGVGRGHLLHSGGAGEAGARGPRGRFPGPGCGARREHPCSRARGAQEKPREAAPLPLRRHPGPRIPTPALPRGEKAPGAGHTGRTLDVAGPGTEPDLGPVGCGGGISARPGTPLPWPLPRAPWGLR